ncbi:2-oxoglutarate dehydrogenase E1 component [Candidatus Riesia pediculischaeffi]|uniref:oxoglutarate dehydrogenase (succinyl-transferring) n=1 Tax=Candidatus Riesia pediculischaeffi PTSU TaxID=1401651 RepID=A0A0C1S9B6_9ENTR|nr:2-oxoglutarate dehydrogenase E1 component [Candidatus Riesia pediculischaeffi]KIE63841.1 2-oxoglutarate dehydrogenase E1 component [Candidatus Riesia pediculischaeffi PTSU]
MPITIHGDASVVGQGIVQETINLYKIDGYSVGGTIRIVLNNQIGFTISKERFLRSSRYCTDIFKFTQFPIFHVNADDIEAVMFSSRIALDFREKFRKDVVVELIGYRRRGHSEIDDPKVTQPVMYHIIEQHETSRSIYSKSLIKNDIITHEDVEDMIGSYRRKLKENSFSSYGINFINDVEHPTDFKNLKIRSNSIIGVKNLQKTLQEIISVPKNFMLHPMVDKILQNRSRIATKESLCDWATSEILAYSTLLQRGFDVRISGEDVSRGTFFQRNFRIYDQIDGKEYFSIEKISNCIGTINVWDSVLSEESTLAFEYGYSLIHNGSLTVWEAQFGDFSNVAQVVIDQFISSGNKKWGIESNLVIFLPHGYEGQGPDHSSARVERYLQLCAEKNMKIFVPSDPSQIYHALLEHCCIDRDQRCPLIVFSPKSLLRHPDCLVGLKELACGRFRKVIGEDEKYSISEKIQRVILCCGKIYYELLEERNVSIKKINKTIAIIRIEQLYPFPNEELKQEIQKYPCVVDFIWCQEEPKNQGAWNYIKEYIKKVIPSYANLSYFGRSELSTSVEGDRVRYRLKQKHIVQSALTG